MSEKANVCTASQRLLDLGVPILGAVVTGAHCGLYGYGRGADAKYHAFLSAGEIK